VLLRGADTLVCRVESHLDPFRSLPRAAQFILARTLRSVGGTQIALYAVVKLTRLRRGAIPIRTVIPASTAISVTTQDVTTHDAAQRKIAVVTADPAAYTFWPPGRNTPLESLADHG
jgi:hypothetical protein